MMKEFVKYKRWNNALDGWNQKLYIPVTLKTKNKIARIARFYRMSQAELGAVIVEFYLEHPILLVECIRRYREVKMEERLEFLNQKGSRYEIEKKGTAED